MPAPDSKPRLVILDSHGILFRAFFALGSVPNPLTSSKGEPTFAVYGYAESLLHVLEMLNPTHICAAWDAGGKTFRHEASEDYKATRRPTPPDLLPQMARVREMMDVFNIPVFEQPGYEADDLAGTLSRLASEQGIETYIVTLDTDLVQLIGPRVNLFMFRPYQRDVVVYDEAKAAERWGFSPKYMIDFKALKGDTSDNVEGIKGIGDKTATTLIRQFGTVESIYEHIDEVKGAVQKKLIDGEERAKANVGLVTIHTDLPVAFDLEQCRVRDYDRERVLEFFRELEFRSLIPRLPEAIGGATAGQSAAVETDYRAVATEADLDELVSVLESAESFAAEVLATASDTTNHLLLGFAFATEPGRAWYVPIGHAPRLDGEIAQLPLARVLDAVRGLFEDPAAEITSYSSKALFHALARQDITVASTPFDVSIAAFLLGETSSTLNSLISERLAHEMISVADLCGTGRKATPLSHVDIERVAPYACEQAEMLLRIRPHLEDQLNERGQWSLFADMELPLARVLFEMERIGVAIDIGVLRDLSQGMIADIARAEDEIYSLAGRPFNIGSPQQLSDVLFKEMGLPHTRKTTQGYSTDQRALESLRPVSPIIDLIFEYRGLTKLKSTYLDALPATVAADGRIHTDYQQTVAATGRLSSTNPNLQNIPVRTETGRDIRKAFVASFFDDAWFVGADYSQVELRILAHVTGDDGLVSAFLDDQDIHRATAATVYGVEPSDVTRQMRDTAKMVNFGIAYGMGEFGLASRTGMTREEAEAFISGYYHNFPGIADWQKETLTFTREHGYAETLFGRRRYLPAIRSTNFQVRSAAEREAINMPIQGTAADIIKLAMIRIRDEMRVRQMSSRMILQVHDELIFECPPEEVDAIRELAPRLMGAGIELKVPLKVDVKQGRTWGGME
ncbi:DNA polymerase I [bacterium]|nr:DNA polymerase I [bacterium]